MLYDFHNRIGWNRFIHSTNVTGVVGFEPVAARLG